MRCQHASLHRARLGSQQIERIGIQYQRSWVVNQRQVQGAPPIRLTQAWAQCNHRGTACTGGQLARATGVRHTFRAGSEQGPNVLGAGQCADQPGAATQRCFHAQTQCAARALVTTDGQHMTMVALVSVGTSRRQISKGAGIDGISGGLLCQERSGRHVQTFQNQLTHCIQSRASNQATLVGDEAHGQRRANRSAGYRSRIGIDAAGHVQRQYWPLKPVDRFDQCGRLLLRRAREANPKQSVDHQIRRRQRQARIEHRHVATRRAPVGKRLFGISAARYPGVKTEHHNLEPCGATTARQHITIAAVVARTAHDKQLVCLRPTPTKQREGRFTGACHQRVAGNSTGNRRSIDGANRGSGIQRLGITHGCDSILAAMSRMHTQPAADINCDALLDQIREWGTQLGFQSVGIAQPALAADAAHLMRWLADGRHGEMDYMARNVSARANPENLQPGTLRVISARMDYFPAAEDAWSVLSDATLGYVSRYALGRDYHKLLRRRLQMLATRIEQAIGSYGYRVYTDSAPVLEKALARNAGLGWIGKHSNLIDTRTGSWFFLGEIYTNLPLPADQATSEHCGTCTRCIPACPTGAIVAPYQVDARRCISYLTVELSGSIPENLRSLMGNRIYGCDDCQLVCPWNKFAKLSAEPDFRVRHGLDGLSLIELFSWDEATFLALTEGSAIRRIGWVRWLRNVAVALGNAPNHPHIVDALLTRTQHPSELVREHVAWALARQSEKAQAEAATGGRESQPTVGA